MILYIILGIVGAVAGGLIFDFFGTAGITGFNVYSLIVAVVGSVVVVWLYRAFTAIGICGCQQRDLSRKRPNIISI